MSDEDQRGETADAGTGKTGSVGVGVLLALALHVGFQLTAYFAALPSTGSGHLASLDALLPLFVIGLSQLVYLLPAWMILRRRGLSAHAKGVAIVMAVTFLLNAACWGLAIS
jgi:hypothetical protein